MRVAQPGFEAPGHGLGVMTRTSGRVDLDIGGDGRGAGPGKSELGQDARHVFFKGFRVRISSGHDPVQFFLVDGGVALEAIVPDIERKQLAAEALADQGGHFFYLGRRQEPAEHRFHVFFRDFPVDVETASDMSGE